MYLLNHRCFSTYFIAFRINHLMMILVFFTAISISTKVISQGFSKFHLEKYTSENEVIQKGLSQNTIAAMAQDKYGFMWFGTWDGLNR